MPLALVQIPLLNGFIVVALVSAALDAKVLMGYQRLNVGYAKSDDRQN